MSGGELSKHYTLGAIVEVENWSVMLRGAEAKVRNFHSSLTYQQRSGGRISVFVGVESVDLSLVALFLSSGLLLRR